MLVAGIQQVEESDSRVEDGCVVDVCGEREIVKVGLKHGFLELGDGGLAAVFAAFFEDGRMLRPRDASIGEQKVDVSLLLADLVSNFGQRFFVGDVADNRPDSSIDGCFGGFFESFFTAADDVYCSCAVIIKRPGSIKTESRTSASNDNYKAFDVEEIAGFVKGCHSWSISVVESRL